MSKIKIFHVLTDTNIGGAGRVLIQFLKSYRRDLFDVTVLLPRGAELLSLVEAEGVPVILTEHGGDKSFDRGAVAEYRKIFRQERPDVVHTHSSLSARIAAYTSGVKSRIYTRHCTFDMPKKLTSFPGKQINGFVNNRLATRIIAVAYSAAENLTDTGVSEKKITVIMNGVSPLREVTEDEKAALRESLGIRTGDFVCGISARLEPYKGHAYLLDAAKKIAGAEAGDRIRFVIMGTGSEEETLKNRVRDEGLSNVVFTGLVKDVAPYYFIMDLQLNCSYGTEATSISLCEGMSIGLPALVTTFGGNPYVIEDGVNGLTVPPRDAEAMAEKILKAASDPGLMRELREGANRIYSEKFTARSMTEQMEKIYIEEAKRIGKEP
ncbi:MAG: glycosyltransferase [Clostridia bacterium]|nr:glycosyltransferase [Clostridia bacterium]